MGRSVVTAFQAGRKRQIGELAERRMKEARKAESTLLENRTGVAHRANAFKANQDPSQVRNASVAVKTLIVPNLRASEDSQRRRQERDLDPCPDRFPDNG